MLAKSPLQWRSNTIGSRMIMSATTFIIRPFFCSHPKAVLSPHVCPLYASNKVLEIVGSS